MAAWLGLLSERNSSQRSNHFPQLPRATKPTVPALPAWRSPHATRKHVCPLSVRLIPHMHGVMHHWHLNPLHLIYKVIPTVAE